MERLSREQVIEKVRKKMSKAKNGDTVKVHYTGKLEDGTVFDSSLKRDPLKFKIGETQVLPGFQEAIIGMSPGESKTEKISAEKAYGAPKEELIFKVEKNWLPSNIIPKVGQMLEVQQSDGQRIPVEVTHISEQEVTLDANYPLAGKDLVFDIELVEII
jgi:peptidylprolyl isomerase